MFPVAAVGVSFLCPQVVGSDGDLLLDAPGEAEAVVAAIEGCLHVQNDVSVGGEQGVVDVLEILRAELANAMLLSGCRSVRDITRALVAPAL